LRPVILAALILPATILPKMIPSRFVSGVPCPAFHVRGDRPTPVVVAPFRFSFDNPEIVIIGFYLRKGKYLSSMTSQWRDA